MGAVHPGDALALEHPRGDVRGAPAKRRGRGAGRFARLQPRRPSAAEARSGQFLRTRVDEAVHGVLVSALGSDTGYFIGALGERCGRARG
ncbi:MAG: hypothetical protein MZW92_02335 [Comamonadaceae bacterium]|nr:hypothetical protein [Comamonadaceae bacterium]